MVARVVANNWLHIFHHICLSSIKKLRNSFMSYKELINEIEQVFVPRWRRSSRAYATGAKIPQKKSSQGSERIAALLVPWVSWEQSSDGWTKECLPDTRWRWPERLTESYTLTGKCEIILHSGNGAENWAEWEAWAVQSRSLLPPCRVEFI